MATPGCCGECSRCSCACTSIGLLWTIDVVSACLGVGLISAAVVIGDIPEVAVFIPNAVTTFAIVLGVIVLVSAAVGLIGVCKAPQLEDVRQKGNWPLGVFAVTSFLIFVGILVALGLVGTLLNENDSTGTNNLLKSSFHGDPVKWVTLQNNLACCGFDNDPTLMTGPLCPTLSPTPHRDATLPIPNQTLYVSVAFSIPAGDFFRDASLPANDVTFTASQSGTLNFTFFKIGKFDGSVSGTPPPAAFNTTVIVTITATKISNVSYTRSKDFEIYVTTPPIIPVTTSVIDCKAPLYTQVEANVGNILGVLLSLLTLMGGGIVSAVALMRGWPCCCAPRNGDDRGGGGGGDKISDDSGRSLCPCLKPKPPPVPEKREFTFSGKSRAG